MEQVIVKNGKALSYGYTTGSCAAAASKIAVETLYTGRKIDYISIDTPKGWKLTIEANYINITSNEVCCYVCKDYSDDPDVTKGIKIYAKATKAEKAGIHIKAGIGIGIVTKNGLSVPVGKPAINPIPMKMILAEVEKVLPTNCGVEIELFVPEGVEVAKKTFNAKLGIMGGISILGTTGIVEPMSEDAFKESLKLELNMKRIINNEIMIFAFGNYGLDFLETYGIDDEMIQRTSNFVEYMIKAAAEIGIKRILYVGHAGKMVKVAAGMKNTHSKYGDYRMESIVKSCDELLDENKQKILNCNTTDEAIVLLKELEVDKIVFTDIANRCKDICEIMGENLVKVECIIFTSIYGEIGTSQNAKKWLKEMCK